MLAVKKLKFLAHSLLYAYEWTFFSIFFSSNRPAFNTAPYQEVTGF